MLPHRHHVPWLVLATFALLLILTPSLALADVFCEPTTHRVIVNPGEPPPSLTIETDYPNPCWELVSANFQWLAPTHGRAEFVVRDMNAGTPGCLTVIQTHRVDAPLGPGQEGCITISIDETVLEADGSLRGQSQCDVLIGVGPIVGLPQLDQSTATSAGGILVSCPAGDGETLASRGATVTVTLRSSLCGGVGVPVVNFPREDVWLQGAVPGAIQLCAGGIIADAPSNAAGIMTISGAIAGGGWSEAGMVVVVLGQLLPEALYIRVHSPDITGDRNVNLADVGPFSADLAAQSGFRSDFFPDDIVNLADVGIFSAHMSHVCD